MYSTNNLPWLYVYHVIAIISFWPDDCFFTIPVDITVAR